MSTRVLGRWVITHWRSPDNTSGRILVRGRDARDTMQRYGIFPTWSPKGKGWALSDEFLPDVCAIAGLEVLGYRVADVDGSECTHADLRAERRTQLREVDPSEDGCTCALLNDLAPLLADVLGAEELWHEHREVA